MVKNKLFMILGLLITGTVGAVLGTKINVIVGFVIFLLGYFLVMKRFHKINNRLENK